MGYNLRINYEFKLTNNYKCILKYKSRMKKHVELGKPTSEYLNVGLKNVTEHIRIPDTS